MNRRGLILGATAALAMPAIIPVERLMKLYVPKRFDFTLADPYLPGELNEETMQAIFDAVYNGVSWMRLKADMEPIIVRSRIYGGDILV